MKISTLLSFLLPLCWALVIPKSITDGSDHALTIAARQAVAAIEATFEFVFEDLAGQEATEEAEVLVTPPEGRGRAIAAGYAPSGTSIRAVKHEAAGTRFFFAKYDEFTGFLGEGEFLYNEAEHQITQWNANSAQIIRPERNPIRLNNPQLILSHVKK